MLTYKFRLSSTLADKEIQLNDFFVSKDLMYISGTTSVANNLSINDNIRINSYYLPYRPKAKVESIERVRRNGYILVPKTLEINALYYYSELSNSIAIPVYYVEFNDTIYFQDTTVATAIVFNINGDRISVPFDTATITVFDKVYIENSQVVVDDIVYNVNINRTSITFSDVSGVNFEVPSSWTVSHATYESEEVLKLLVKADNTISFNVSSINRFGYEPYIDYMGERIALSELNDDTGKLIGYGVNIDGKNYLYSSSFVADDDTTLNQYASGTTVNIDGDEYEILYESMNFGYIPYIIYDDEIHEFMSLYDGDTYEGYGVKVNGYNYPCSAEMSVHKDIEIDEDSYFGLSNPDAYDGWEANFNIGLNIDGESYMVNYEPREMYNGDFLCIESESEDLPILMDDIITLKEPEFARFIDVNTFNGISYVFVNGNRYNSIENLCDQVYINGVAYDLEYEGDSSHPFIGMHATVVFDDNTEQTFKVYELKDDTHVSKLCKINKVNGIWKDAYTMTVDASTGAENSSYQVKANNYTVINKNGFLINNKKYPIQQKLYYDDEYRDVIYISAPQEYDLKVIDVIGSNKFICTIDLDIEQVSSEEYVLVRNDIFQDIVNSDSFVAIRNVNAFGNRKLYAYKWLNEAINNGGGTSIPNLAQTSSRVSLIKYINEATIQIPLNKSLNNSLSKQDVLSHYYFTDKENAIINTPVDLDKDIYRPVYFDGNTPSPIEKITFNLHFRTRDLETWKIIEDEGVDSTGKNKSANNLFSNWFITDYYPYNQYATDAEHIEKLVNQSDLLGLLYFTTNDVQVKREKLARSFLRLTFFDSRDPNKQNMLGTSTVFFNTEKYFDILAQPHEGICYHKVAKSLADTWSETATTQGFDINYKQAASVLMEPYKPSDISSIGQVTDLLCDTNYRLDSQMNVADRYTAEHSSEGFYAYILKAFGSKVQTKRVYMKIEFFHAGVGIKIPMAIATDNEKNAISYWHPTTLENLKKGYDLNEIYQRQYVPIDIQYSKERKEYVYNIATDNNYSAAIKQGSNLVFNLFEIKGKTE